MNKRISELRTNTISILPHLCHERACLLTESWRRTEGSPISIRRAKALAHILENMTILIKPGELIVGNPAEKPVASPVFPEYGIQWMERELDSLPTRELDKYLVTDETRSKLQEVFDFWRGKSYYDFVKEEILLSLPENILKAWDPENAVLNQAVTNSGKVTSGDGHVIANFEKVLNLGLNGITDEVNREIKKTEPQLQHPEAIEKLVFLKSLKIVLNGVIIFAERFSEAAAKLASQETDEKRRQELKQMAAICAKVPAYPAETLWEALQSCWFVQLILQIESNGHSMSLGRFDQYMAPFYLKDIESGKTTDELTKELIQCFIIKCNEIKKARQMSHTRVMHGYPMFQTLTLGGQHRDGSDATNVFTYLVLDAMADVKMQEPTVVARIHDRSPQEFMIACGKSVVEHGGGFPGFFNDEVAIPSLMSTGVTLEDARDWAIDGCSELLVPGKHNTITGGTCHFNLLKILELALNDGKNPETGARVCSGIGDLDQFTSYQDVENAYKKQLEFYLGVAPILDNITSKAYARLTPTPFLSSVLDYRIQYGKDVEEGGGPNYQNTIVLGHGTVNVGNSLFNIKKLVFDEKQVALDELKLALETNFEGQRGQRIKKMLLESAKYGNGEDEVDKMVANVMNWFCDGITRYVPARGGHYCPTPQTLSANTYTGESIGATPDGRSAGEPTADNISPMAGTDRNGVTATLKSVAKLDHAKATNGTILNVKLHPTAVSGDERIAKFAALVKGFFDLKGMQVQFNIVSAETLKEAKKNPEKYSNLIVKVAGYSALFTTLDEKLQDQIIARTEHSV